MKIKLLIMGFGLLFLNATGVVADPDPYVDYDNFNKKKVHGCKFCLDPEKWRGTERGDYVTEILREIKAKRARLWHRSWGSSDSDAGRESGRNRMQFRDSVNFSGVCYTPRIKKYQIGSCAGNPDNSNIRMRHVGNFYDVDTADAGEEDGIVYAGINIRRDSDSGAKKGIFEVSGWIEECAGTDCDAIAWSSYDDTNVDLYFGTIKAAKNKKEVCIGYDRGNIPAEAQFVFSFGNDVRVLTAADGLPPLDGNMTPDWTWHVIETRVDSENCSAGAISGSMDADVDNVKVSEFQ